MSSRRASSGPGLSFLVVDDDEAIREFLSLWLASKGHRVRTVGDGRKVTVFVASDSVRAKQTAAALAESIGFDVVDAGDLRNARYLEPLAGLNIYLGYGAGLGTAIAPAWIRKA